MWASLSAGVVLLARVLEKNKTIHSFDVSFNGLTRKGTRYMINCLKNNVFITELFVEEEVPPPRVEKACSTVSPTFLIALCVRRDSSPSRSGRWAGAAPLLPTCERRSIKSSSPMRASSW